MNKKLMRIISAVMAICLLACMIVPAASAILRRAQTDR